VLLTISLVVCLCRLNETQVSIEVPKNIKNVDMNKFFLLFLKILKRVIIIENIRTIKINNKPDLEPDNIIEVNNVIIENIKI
jgi:hypothetical protein